MSSKSYIPIIPVGDEYKLAFPGTMKPKPNGTANVGSSDKWAREDHIHPGSTSMFDTVMNQVKNQNAAIIFLGRNKEGIGGIDGYNKTAVLSFDVPKKFREGVVVFHTNNTQTAAPPAKRTFIDLAAPSRSFFVNDNYEECRRLFSLMQYNNGEAMWSELGDDNLFDKTYMEMGGQIERGTEDYESSFNLFSHNSGLTNQYKRLSNGDNTYDEKYACSSWHGDSIYNKIKFKAGNIFNNKKKLKFDLLLFSSSNPSSSNYIGTITGINENASINLPSHGYSSTYYYYFNMYYEDGSNMDLNNSDIRIRLMYNIPDVNPMPLYSVLMDDSVISPNNSFIFQSIWLEPETQELKIAVVCKNSLGHKCDFKTQIATITFWGNERSVKA